MSLKIRIPKNTAGPSIQAAEPAIRQKPSKRRSAVLDSDDEYDGDDASITAESKPSKRARTEELSVVDEGDFDEEVNIDDAVSDDTRFLPQTLDEPTYKRGSGKKAKPPPRRTKKRAVVLSDDEGGEEDYEDNQDVVVDDDDYFTPEPATSRRTGIPKVKSKSIKPAVAEKKNTARDERKAAPAGRRGVSANDFDGDADSKAGSVEPAAPAPKKRKLPTIKKNKPTAGTPTPSGAPVPKLSTKASSGDSSALDNLALPVVGGRKPAATANNADFDLRDKSVYASLFMKPGGITPNSGLSRKEKEEERRRELNKMREDARAKRGAEAQESFDLQAPQEKIARFEKRLRLRVGEAAVMYPNILGGAFRDAMEVSKGVRVRSRPPHRGP
ncbi:hypothetical protein PHLGIDRAFT_126229 [Phlebiopsis gigantea 11061_1 CR5-6]|uniref:Uncharacterized protein n=1 Tax=Phlebiopsis gigantea (strain 11061_1 CR5-6) TaxID=745531 RepID=A0A0C3S2G3_PHLG1|nr:hypothetical protein PHLGIDRAFT_126229 [Phlebiopsis gigantea 11061_1 CR5-6]